MNYTPENALITGLFWDDPTGGTATDRASMILDPEDFEHEGYRQAFRAMIELRKKNEPIEMFAVSQKMVEMGIREEDAWAWLSDATHGSPLVMPGFIERYADKIKAASRSRQLTSAIGLAGERLQDGDDIANVKTRLVSEIEEIESERHLSQDKPISDLIMPTLNALADKLSGDDSKRGMQTGLTALDGTTSGLNPGEFWIVGAMPGRGKTAFALQVAMNVAGSGYPVFFMSLEMSGGALVRRLLKMNFGAKVVDNPNEAQWNAILEYGAELKLLPLFINESSALDAADVAQHARVMVARHKIRLIIVDYLQIVKGPGRDRRERTGDAANVLRSLAKDTGVPVLALSQLRRPDSLNDRPSMIDLKESGDLEAHAHVVLLMHMPINDDGTFTGEEEIIIGKQREGPTGSIPVVFDRSKAIFKERWLK